MHPKAVRQLPQRLGRAEHEVAVRLHRGGKPGKHPRQLDRAEVDQHIAAEDQLAARRRYRDRRAAQIVVPELHVSAQIRLDFPARTASPKVVASTLAGHALDLGVGVHALARPIQRPGREVSAKHYPVLKARLRQEHGHAVGLLSVRAAGAPDLHRLRQPRHHVRREGGEDLRVTEERGLLDSDPIQQPLKHLRVMHQRVDERVNAQSGGRGLLFESVEEAAAQARVEPQSNASGHEGLHARQRASAHFRATAPTARMTAPAILSSGSTCSAAPSLSASRGMP